MNLFRQISSLSHAEASPRSGFHTILRYSGEVTVSPARQLHLEVYPWKCTCEVIPRLTVTASIPENCQFSKYRHMPAKRKLSKPIYSQ